MFLLRRIFIDTAALSILLMSADLIAAKSNLQQQLDLLKAQVGALEAKVLEQEQEKTQQQQQLLDTPQAALEVQPNAASEKADGIKFGGAIRTNFSHTSYSDGNEDRGGDFD